MTNIISRPSRVLHSSWSLTHALMVLRRAFVVVLLMGTLFAGALTSQQAHATETAPPTTGLSADQAQQLITVLSNDAQRQEFLTTLRNLTKAEQSSHHASLIELVQANLSSFGERTLAQLHILHQNIIDFGAIAPWSYRVIHDGALQGRIIHIGLRVFIMLAGGFLLFYGVRFLLRPLQQRISNSAKTHNQHVFLNEAQKLRAAQTVAKKDEATAQADQAEENIPPNLAQAASQNAVPGISSPPPAADTAQTDKTTDEAEEKLASAEESLRHQGALAQLMSCLRRTPYALAAATLDLISVVMFPLLALLIGALDPAATPQSTHAIWSITWLIGVSVGLWTIFLRIFLAPQALWLRLSILHDRAANFLFHYFRKIGVILGWGFAFLAVLHDMSLPMAVSHGLQKILMLVAHLLLAIMIIRARGMVRHACERVSAMNHYLHSIMPFISHAWWIAALFFDLALWLVWAADISGGYQLILQLFVRTVVALTIVRIISILAYGGLERFMRALDSWNLNPETLTRIRRYYPAAATIIRIIVAILTVLALALAWGAPVYSLVGHNTLGSRIFHAAMTVLVALIIGVIAWELANITIEHHIRRLGEYDSRETKIRVARLQTLTPMFRILFLLVLAVIIGLTVLSQLGIDTAPLIASASIFGVALGFGSQKLVQDFISGIFLLLENALTVGDAVTLNGTYGVVERLSLRSVHVRANDGSMNIFSFSALSQVTNYNREFSRAMIIAVVDIDTDTDAVVAVFAEVAKELRNDPAFKDLIIADFNLWGVSAIGESSVTVRGVYPTTTAGRWAVEWEFNRRMKKRFEEKGIQYPRDVVDIQGPALDQFVASAASKPTPPPQNPS